MTRRLTDARRRMMRVRRGDAVAPSEHTLERVRWLMSLVSSGALSRSSGLLVRDVEDPDGAVHPAEPADGLSSRPLNGDGLTNGAGP